MQSDAHLCCFAGDATVAIRIQKVETFRKAAELFFGHAAILIGIVILKTLGLWRMRPAESSAYLVEIWNHFTTHRVSDSSQKYKHQTAPGSADDLPPPMGDTS